MAAWNGRHSYPVLSASAQPQRAMDAVRFRAALVHRGVGGLRCSWTTGLNGGRGFDWVHYMAGTRPTAGAHCHGSISAI